MTERTGWWSARKPERKGGEAMSKPNEPTKEEMIIALDAWVGDAVNYGTTYRIKDGDNERYFAIRALISRAPLVEKLVEAARKQMWHVENRRKLSDALDAYDAPEPEVIVPLAISPEQGAEILSKVAEFKAEHPELALSALKPEEETMEKIEFTKDPPDCPKCGGFTRRIYYKSEHFWDEIQGEYLLVRCQSCGYGFTQKVKSKP
jgi:hypothetical protein